MILEFFAFEFVVVFVILTLVQMVGLESNAPVIAGLVGGASGVVGSALFRRPRQRTSSA
jgi:hypothetical protein